MNNWSNFNETFNNESFDLTLQLITIRSQHISIYLKLAKWYNKIKLAIMHYILQILNNILVWQ